MTCWISLCLGSKISNLRYPLTLYVWFSRWYLSFSKLDKKATYEFLKKFYEKKDKTTRLKNDATGKFANKLNGIGFISPEEYTKRLENKTVVSANKEHDVPILSAFAGK